jgi:hypothetical protein
MLKPIAALAVGAASTALAIGGQPLATAAGDSVGIRVLTTDVAAPFNIHVTKHGIYYADGGPGIVGKLRKDGSTKTLVARAPGASGVAYRDGKLAYTTTVSNPKTHVITASALHIRGPHRHLRVATLAYERSHNPDKVNTYGIANPTPCQVEAMGPQARYKGLKDSHAYSVVAWGNKWLVADAGANAIFVVNKRGHIRTLSVLPPQPTVITAEAATALDLDPECFEGAKYRFEPVPTDVEVKHGRIYVTTLPGGPESDALGKRGAVYRINPSSGKAMLVAKGFAGATNLAVGRHGKIFVAELFGGRISTVMNGKVRTHVKLPGAIAVEKRDRGLWGSTIDPTFQGPGSIVRFN